MSTPMVTPRSLSFPLTLLLALAAGSTAYAQEAPRDTAWKRAAQIAAVLSTAAIVADVSLSKLVLEDGGRERNPLLGHDPSDVELVAAAAAAVTANLFLPKLIFGDDYRSRFFSHAAVFVVEGGIVLYVARQL